MAIAGSNAQHCVTYFEDSACHSLGGLDIVNGNSCANVNTGTQVNSFKCSANTNLWGVAAAKRFANLI
ncbi:hypothetical protein D9613_008496 [Agrocybe pediades]|uniref:Uncharacterized protein n=1 Tax=Agrocybe pediades TaxID=84607 RepID=A0A8H4QRZ2_9AGAR|nr:hypothetical protein D9613_008496 [Agrocybe pediades]